MEGCDVLELGGIQRERKFLRTVGLKSFEQGILGSIRMTSNDYDISVV